jgi:hypothetical protein
LELLWLNLQLQPGSSSSSGSSSTREQHLLSNSCKLFECQIDSSRPMAAPALMALTGLTQLRIWECDVICFGNGMVQLTALSGLQSLRLSQVHVQPCSAADAAAYSAALASTLGQLCQLTHLSLAGKFNNHASLFKSGAVLAAAGNFSSMKTLHLEWAGTHEDPASMQDLPDSLVELHVEGGAISSSSSSDA